MANRVPIQGSSSRRFSNHWYLSPVEAQYWKPKIVVTWIPISSLFGICPNTNLYCLMKSIKHKSRIVKADLGCVNSNTSIPGRYSAWYSTSNKVRFPSYFWITIPVQVIRRSLLDNNSKILTLQFYCFDSCSDRDFFFCRFSCFWSCSSTAWSRRRFYLSLWQFPEESLTTFQTKMQVAFFPDNKCFPVIECPEFGSYLFSGGSKIEHI